jgi:hypothetical protein
MEQKMLTIEITRTEFHVLAQQDPNLESWDHIPLDLLYEWLEDTSMGALNIEEIGDRFSYFFESNPRSLAERCAEWLQDADLIDEDRLASTTSEQGMIDIFLEHVEGVHDATYNAIVFEDIA